jgi:hypothetical protein
VASCNFYDFTHAPRVTCSNMQSQAGNFTAMALIVYRRPYSILLDFRAHGASVVDDWFHSCHFGENVGLTAITVWYHLILHTRQYREICLSTPGPSHIPLFQHQNISRNCGKTVPSLAPRPPADLGLGSSAPFDCRSSSPAICCMPFSPT